MGNEVEKQKHIFIEVLRIIACFLVIVNHTSHIFLNSYGYLQAPMPISWFIDLTYFFICKISVPIFVMISGYTMLDKQDGYKKSLKRVFRIVMALVVFSSIYYVNQCVRGERFDIGVGDYLHSLFQSPMTIAYWYLYMYIGLLIMMPFLQKLVSAMNKRDCQIMICISLFVYAIWPIMEYNWPALGYSKIVDFSIFTSFVNMLLIGYYIKKYVEPSKRLSIVSLIVFVGATVFNVVMTYYEYQKKGGVNYLFYENRVLFPIIIQAVSVCCIVMYYRWDGRFTGVLKTVGGCTFGIYLLSDFLIQKLTFVYHYLCTMGIHPIISEVLWQITIFIIALVITLILKRMPGIKKLI